MMLNQTTNIFGVFKIGIFISYESITNNLFCVAGE